MAPSRRMAKRLVWTLVVHALGGAGAVAIVSGLVAAIADVGVGLAAIAAGVGLACICWGLSDREWRVTTPPALRLALPARRDAPPRPGEPPDGVGAPRAA